MDGKPYLVELMQRMARGHTLIGAQHPQAGTTWTTCFYDRLGRPLHARDWSAQEAEDAIYLEWVTLAAEPGKGVRHYQINASGRRALGDG